MAARVLARTSAGRAKFSFYVTVVFAALLLAKLVDVQVVEGPKYARLAADQRLHKAELYGRRGNIYDRDGTVLVRSLPSQSIYVVVNQVGDKDRVAAQLAPILHVSQAVLVRDFSADAQFRLIAPKVSHAVADRVAKLRLDCIQIVPEDTGARFVTSGRLASTVLGFVGVDDNGLDGAEYSFDALLRGKSGVMTFEADEFGRALPFGESTVVTPAHAGHGVGLTIDSFLQFETERLLRDAVRKYSAQSGTAIVMDPWTGEILALANAPDFDPMHFGSSSPEALRDRAVQDAYEPGSTFKLITAAAALESGRVNVDTTFPARDVLEVGGRTIHNAEDGLMASKMGSETLEDIIAFSHNVGAAEVGMAIGPSRLYRTIRAFGFGDPTHVELPGENPGIVNPPSDWSGSSLATISFGHGVSVTPIALARAYAAIANGGTLLRPRVVSALYDANGSVIYRYGPEIERRNVISPQTAAVLRTYLRAVVVRGTGNPTARVPGYTTAGKTGTAQVVENGYYLGGAYIASFVGMIPAEHPRFVILVKVDRPHGSIYGSEVAAPVFAEIARTAMLHAGAMPDPRLIPKTVKPVATANLAR